MPEDTRVMSPDQQMEALLRELAGHPIFARLRGTLCRPVIEQLDRRRTGRSPTSARDDIREWGKDLAWAQGLMARLERDGHHVAASELHAALNGRAYHMLGEKVRVEETMPVTIVLYRPDVLIPLIHWLNVLDRRPEDFQLAAEGHEDAHPGLLQAFQLFPELKGFGNRSARVDGDFEDFLDWMAARFSFEELDAIIDALRSNRTRSLDWVWCDLSVGVFYPGSRTLSGGHITRMFAKLFRATQREVLRILPRDRQDHFATWQIELPAMYAEHEGLNIGLHPEDQHVLWQRRYPALAGSGLQCGHGAIAIPHTLVRYARTKAEDAIEPGERLVFRTRRRL